MASSCRNAGRLAGIPGVLLHGRLDLGSPLTTAWELAQAWPDADLVVVDDSGHTRSDTMRELHAPRHGSLRGRLDLLARGVRRRATFLGTTIRHASTMISR